MTDRWSRVTQCRRYALEALVITSRGTPRVRIMKRENDYAQFSAFALESVDTDAVVRTYEDLRQAELTPSPAS